jgi:hypothetical protein
MDADFSCQAQSLISSTLDESIGKPKSAMPTTQAVLKSNQAQLFQRCEKLLDTYDTLADEIAHQGSVVSPEILEGWEEDRRKVGRLLELGKRTAMREIVGLVGKKTPAALAAEGEDVDEVETHIAKGVYAEVRKKGGAVEGPAQALQEIQRGVARMIRAVPSSDTDNV